MTTFHFFVVRLVTRPKLTVSRFYPGIVQRLLSFAFTFQELRGVFDGRRINRQRRAHYVGFPCFCVIPCRRKGSSPLSAPVLFFGGCAPSAASTSSPSVLGGLFSSVLMSEAYQISLSSQYEVEAVRFARGHVTREDAEGETSICTAWGHRELISSLLIRHPCCSEVMSF